MGKLLRSKDTLLLVLSGVLDLFEEVRDPLQLMSKSYENMYGFVPRRYKRHHFNHLVWRSMKTGSIERVEKNEEVHLRLTSEGQKKVTRDFPLVTMQQKPWDRKWRLVIFDIEELNRSARDNLRKKLKELGFGMLQESVFITSHDLAEDIAEFITNLGLSNYVYVLETSKILVGDVRALANKVWKLDEINLAYEKIIEDLENEYLNYKRGRVNRLNNKGFIAEVKRAYLEVLFRDPFLPREVLPLIWKREEAKKRMQVLLRRTHRG